MNNEFQMHSWIGFVQQEKELQPFSVLKLIDIENDTKLD